MRKYVMGDNYFKNKKDRFIISASGNLRTKPIHKQNGCSFIFFLGLNMDKLASFWDIGSNIQPLSVDMASIRVAVSEIV